MKNKRSIYYTLLLLFPVMLVHSDWVPEPEQVSVSQKPSLYFTPEDASWEAIAQTFMGDSSYASLLATFNGMDTNTPLEPNTPLVVPGKDWEKAREQLEQLNELADEARAEQAPLYATDSFARGTSLSALAETAFNEARFLRSMALSEQGFNDIKTAIELTQERALSPYTISLKQVQGQVQSNLYPVVSGARILPNTTLSSSMESRAQLELSAQAMVYIAPNTELVVLDCLQDQRDEKIKVVLKLIKGEIEIDTLKEASLSSLEIIADSTRATLKNAQALIEADHDGTFRFMVRRGTLAVSQGELTSEINHGQGLVTVAGEEGISAVLDLPTIPIPVYPAHQAMSYSQVNTLRWNHESPTTVKGFFIELSETPTFNRSVNKTFLTQNAYQTTPLKSGNYYWRVEAVDRFGMRSLPSAAQELVVQMNLDVQIMTTDETRYVNRNLHTGGNPVFTITPVHQQNSIDHIEYRLNDSPYRLYAGEIPLTQYGWNDIYARGISIDDSPGAEKHLRIFLDNLPPRIRFLEIDTVHVPGVGKRKAVTIMIDDEFGIQRYQIRINDRAVSKEEAELLLLDPSRTHNIEVFALDTFNNENRQTFRIRPEGKEKGSFFERLFD